MKRRLLLLLVTLALAVQPACASKYRSLNKEMKSYTPAPLYLGLDGGGAAKVAPPARATPVAGDAAIEAEVRSVPASGAEAAMRQS